MLLQDFVEFDANNRLRQAIQGSSCRAYFCVISRNPLFEAMSNIQLVSRVRSDADLRASSKVKIYQTGRLLSRASHTSKNRQTPGLINIAHIPSHVSKMINLSHGLFNETQKFEALAWRSFGLNSNASILLHRVDYCNIICAVQELAQCTTKYWFPSLIRLYKFLGLDSPSESESCINGSVNTYSGVTNGWIQLPELHAVSAKALLLFDNSGGVYALSKSLPSVLEFISRNSSRTGECDLSCSSTIPPPILFGSKLHDLPSVEELMRVAQGRSDEDSATAAVAVALSPLLPLPLVYRVMHQLIPSSWARSYMIRYSCSYLVFGLKLFQ